MFTPLKKYFVTIQTDPVWSKFLLFSLTLFFVRLADAMVSYWAPNQIQNTLNDTFLMGLVISFQSLVGFLADLTFPTLLKTTKVRRLIYLSIATLALATLCLASTAVKPFILVFLVTMGLWGTYYELIGFANYQFMGTYVPPHKRSSAWSVQGIFVNLAYFLGPLLGAFLLLKGYLPITGAILLFLFLGLVLLLTYFKKEHEVNVVPIDLRDINPWEEMKHWITLTKVIWPAIIITLLLGIIDSTFWTIGAIWTESLSKLSFWGGFFLPAYQLPSIFLGLIIASWGIYKGKKILTEKILILAGVLLVVLGFSVSIPMQLIIVILSSSALAICYPLIQGVYTDLVVRMGKEQKDMIGLTSSALNVSYIIWPPVAGLIASKVGELKTFGVIGGMTAIISLILLFITPKKLRLPQEEILSWSLKDH